MMGFPNVDIFLTNKFVEKFQTVQAEPEFAINDLFSDLPETEQEEVATYINRKVFTADLRNRADSTVYIMPHFPLFDMPLPQIGISLGNENTTDSYLRDNLGDAIPVYAADGTTQTHWDIPKGYFAKATYKIDVASTTKDETIWLSRFVQRFICEEQDALGQIDVFNIELNLMDVQIDQQMFPTMVFARQIQMGCSVLNLWHKRIPVETYMTGLNMALTS